MPASRWINSAEELVDLLGDSNPFGERPDEPIEAVLSSIVAEVKEETAPEAAPKPGAPGC